MSNNFEKYFPVVVWATLLLFLAGYILKDTIFPKHELEIYSTTDSVAYKNPVNNTTISSKETENKSQVAQTVSLSKNSNFDKEAREYMDSMKFSLAMADQGGKYLFEATAKDLETIAYTPWSTEPEKKIHEQFVKAIKANRTEISQSLSVTSLEKGLGTNILGKYEYTASGVILALKSIYLDIAVVSAREWLLDTEQAVVRQAEIKQSMIEIKAGIISMEQEEFPKEPMHVTLYDKDGKFQNQLIQITQLINGNYGIKVK